MLGAQWAYSLIPFQSKEMGISIDQVESDCSTKYSLQIPLKFLRNSLELPYGESQGYSGNLLLCILSIWMM